MASVSVKSFLVALVLAGTEVGLGSACFGGGCGLGLGGLGFGMPFGGFGGLGAFGGLGGLGGLGMSGLYSPFGMGAYGGERGAGTSFLSIVGISSPFVSGLGMPLCCGGYPFGYGAGLIGKRSIGSATNKSTGLKSTRVRRIPLQRVHKITLTAMTKQI